MAEKEKQFQSSIEDQNEVWEPITRPFVLKQAYSLGIYDEGVKKKPQPVVGEKVAEAKKLFNQRSLERGLSMSKEEGTTCDFTSKVVEEKRRQPDKCHR